MLKIEGLRVELPGFALQDIHLEIASEDYFVLVGPSASGKTVLLETIAGMHRVSAGHIWLDQRDITRLEPERRQLGMVYQDCALFPHLSVAENIAFGLKVRGRPPSHIARQQERLVRLLDIGPLLARRTTRLSGGERQKVALARALMTDPEVLLLDEPLGALDPQTRENVREEIIKLHTELALTIIHVTHDFEEAVAMGQNIAVIGAGAIRQVGPADEIFRHPDSEFVARFTMAVNVFPGRTEEGPAGTSTFVVADARLLTRSTVEGPCWAAIRPDSIQLVATSSEAGPDNRFTGQISRIINKGSVVEVTVDLPPAMTCLLTRHGFDQLDLAVGRPVCLVVPPAAVHLFQD